jgi:hypothetical protein
MKPHHKPPLQLLSTRIPVWPECGPTILYHGSVGSLDDLQFLRAGVDLIEVTYLNTNQVAYFRSRTDRVGFTYAGGANGFWSKNQGQTTLGGSYEMLFGGNAAGSLGVRDCFRESRRGEDEAFDSFSRCFNITVGGSGADTASAPRHSARGGASNRTDVLLLVRARPKGSGSKILQVLWETCAGSGRRCDMVTEHDT